MSGTPAVFRVYAEHTFAKDHFPTQQVYGPAPDPKLRLITCGGCSTRLPARTRAPSSSTPLPGPPGLHIPEDI
jgi:hypothetical protein